MTTGSEKRAAVSFTNQSARAVLQEFDDYSNAQRLVDRLSDSGFPVEHLQIVGTGIRTVEQVSNEALEAECYAVVVSAQHQGEAMRLTGNQA